MINGPKADAVVEVASTSTIGAPKASPLQTQRVGPPIKYLLISEKG